MTRRRPSVPDTAEETLLTLGSLVEQALERIKLQRARVDLATALQRHMLPPQLPDLPGLQFAARYVPARNGLEVGGDWYDAFSLADGSIGVVIGDVQGHDVDAVAVMGQVRASLRAVGGVTANPGEVLSAANDLLVALGCGLFATCTLLRIGTTPGPALSGARAGHVPTVWATPDGCSGTLLGACGPPLGILQGAQYPVIHGHMGASEEVILVMVTDGVVEGPHFCLDEGLERVRQVVTADLDADPETMVSRVMKVADLTGHDDDAAALVVRRHRTPAPP
ncbi:PP2C family protein-serine/threonine phosphatase [Peterkaempfera griseoplana]|uniref:PP2C family protein-serine/threonine phosphatase n=1 Tax=Peterkaempfera griseoplana TaxID=66896 RepID=UPI0006E31D3E|nr:PP2C family protein-serine/threonine phosphatase [Peterkaempfera griseoplana]